MDDHESDNLATLVMVMEILDINGIDDPDSNGLPHFPEKNIKL